MACLHIGPNWSVSQRREALGATRAYQVHSVRHEQLHTGRNATYSELDFRGRIGETDIAARLIQANSVYATGNEPGLRIIRGSENVLPVEEGAADRLVEGH